MSQRAGGPARVEKRSKVAGIIEPRAHLKGQGFPGMILSITLVSEHKGFCPASSIFSNQWLLWRRHLPRVQNGADDEATLKQHLVTTALV
jgi:hypothetical protein